MKRDPLSLVEQIAATRYAAKKAQEMIDAGYAPDDKAAAVLVHNETLRYVLNLRKSEGQQKGGEATASNAVAKSPGRKDLERVIRGVVSRGGDPYSYVQEWLNDYDIAKSTLYRRIKLARERQK